VVSALREIGAATGVQGMVGGQYVDVTEQELDADGLRALHELKTGKLICASVNVALSLAGLSEPATIPYSRFADELGVLFQIVDDILDVTGSDEELGKPHGSDERHGKLTYVSLFGLERARELAAESHAKARAALAGADGDTRDLERITDFIHTRQR
jgi:geranylgeranyl diphosphate synthase type II